MSHTIAPPFQHSSGPKDAKIALVGEAFGVEESSVGKPFVGPSGFLLTSLLKDAGIDRRDCFLTNVFAFQPSNNDLDTLCALRAEVGEDYRWPSIKQGKYVLPEYLPEIGRLTIELTTVKPNVVVALGNIATWALLNTTGIGSIRGTPAISTLIPHQKVFPTYHPANVIRDFMRRMIVLADFGKVREEAASPDLTWPDRRVFINPTIEEVEGLCKAAAKGLLLSVDCECTKGQIDMIGFSINTRLSFVVPFFNNRTFEHYWKDPSHETRAWIAVRDLLQSRVPKLFQNGLFDLQYILKHGIRPRNCRHDSMLLHHAKYPELPKGLGFLGSIYAKVPPWKLMRHTKDEELKSDE